MNDESSDKKEAFSPYYSLKDDYDCDIFEWDLSSVTDMNDMFSVRNIIATKFPKLDRIRIPSFTVADVKSEF